MLLSFSTENWRAFKERSTLSLKASREKYCAEKSAKLPAMYGTTKILPVAAIYGANASGKTTQLEGLALLKELVVSGTQVNQMIPIVPFMLDSDYKRKPVDFEVELLIDNLIYVYSVSLTRSDVEEERLIIKRTRNDQLIFKRHGDYFEFGPKFDSSRNLLIAENTRPNQLFLHNAVSQNANDFRPVFDWFDKSLAVLGVDAQYESYSRMLLRPDFLEFVNNKLRRYNTGVEAIDLAPVSAESIPAPPGFIDDFLSSAVPGSNATLQIRVNKPGGSEIFIVCAESEEGTPSYSKVKAVHRGAEGERIIFELSDESKGTQRLIELLPVFFDLASLPTDGEPTEKVYVVDEIDRSFHSALTIDLLKGYLGSCTPDTRHQLIFTTHDLLIMEEKVLRRDELWACEKDDTGESSLKCFGSHPGLRADADLLKHYRSGLIGGYPEFKE